VVEVVAVGLVAAVVPVVLEQQPVLQYQLDHL